MKEINQLLNYNNLKIVQNNDWFKFSIDSVLLANFVEVLGNKKILDLCTGNAPVPLFLSTKTKSNIIGVELQKGVYDLGKESIKINNLDNQISLINKDIKEISSIYASDTFDIITCNPPYFKLNNNYMNENIIKASARHEINMRLEDLFKISKKLLKNNGKIYIIHRTERLSEIIKLMIENNIQPKKIRFIHPFIDKKSNLVLVEGSKNGKSGLKVEKPLVIYSKDGEYTKEINDIFNGGNNEN